MASPSKGDDTTWHEVNVATETEETKILGGDKLVLADVDGKLVGSVESSDAKKDEVPPDPQVKFVLGSGCRDITGGITVGSGHISGTTITCQPWTFGTPPIPMAPTPAPAPITQPVPPFLPTLDLSTEEQREQFRKLTYAVRIIYIGNNPEYLRKLELFAHAVYHLLGEKRLSWTDFTKLWGALPDEDMNYVRGCLASIEGIPQEKIDKFLLDKSETTKAFLARVWVDGWEEKQKVRHLAMPDTSLLEYLQVIVNRHCSSTEVHSQIVDDAYGIAIRAHFLNKLIPFEQYKRLKKITNSSQEESSPQMTSMLSNILLQLVDLSHVSFEEIVELNANGFKMMNYLFGGIIREHMDRFEKEFILSSRSPQGCSEGCIWIAMDDKEFVKLLEPMTNMIRPSQHDLHITRVEAFACEIHAKMDRQYLSWSKFLGLPKLFENVDFSNVDRSNMTLAMANMVCRHGVSENRLRDFIETNRAANVFEHPPYLSEYLEKTWSVPPLNKSIYWKCSCCGFPSNPQNLGACHECRKCRETKTEKKHKDVPKGDIPPKENQGDIPPKENHKQSRDWRNFQVGDFLHAKDTNGSWYDATILKVADDKIFVHYEGWGPVWDEWIQKDSDRLKSPKTNGKLSRDQRIAIFIMTKSWCSASHYAERKKELHTKLESMGFEGQISWDELRELKCSGPMGQAILFTLLDLSTVSKSDFEKYFDFEVLSVAKSYIRETYNQWADRQDKKNDMTTTHEQKKIQAGDFLYMKDTRGDWYDATVLKVADDKIFVHYVGWSPQWDEWIPNNSDRLKPPKPDGKLSRDQRIAIWKISKSWADYGESKKELWTKLESLGFRGQISWNELRELTYFGPTSQAVLFTLLDLSSVSKSELEKYFDSTVLDDAKSYIRETYKEWADRENGKLGERVKEYRKPTDEEIIKNLVAMANVLNQMSDPKDITASLAKLSVKIASLGIRGMTWDLFTGIVKQTECSNGFDGALFAFVDFTTIPKDKLNWEHLQKHPEAKKAYFETFGPFKTKLSSDAFFRLLKASPRTFTWSDDDFEIVAKYADSIREHVGFVPLKDWCRIVQGVRTDLPCDAGIVAACLVDWTAIEQWKFEDVLRLTLIRIEYQQFLWRLFRKAHKITDSVLPSENERICSLCETFTEAKEMGQYLKQMQKLFNGFTKSTLTWAELKKRFPLVANNIPVQILFCMVDFDTAPEDEIKVFVMDSTHAFALNFYQQCLYRLPNSANGILETRDNLILKRVHLLDDEQAKFVLQLVDTFVKRNILVSSLTKR